MNVKILLTGYLASYTFFLLSMESPKTQTMIDSPHAVSSVSGEEKQEYTPTPLPELAQIMPLNELEMICRLNKDGDPLIAEYEQRYAITKKYPSSACLEFFAHVQKTDIPTISPCETTICSNGSAESAILAGVVSAAYFFRSKQYFCTASLRDRNGQCMPPRYVNDSTFGILYARYQEQETKRRNLTQLEEEIKRHNRLKASANQQSLPDARLILHMPPQQSEQA